MFFADPLPSRLRQARSFVLFAALTACLGASPAEPGSPRLDPCPGPGGTTARCTTVQVPENHDAPSGRTIGLRVMVLPATSGRSLEPIVFLAGGPGQSAIGLAGLVASRHAASRADHDLVLVDQRGTGGSNRLHCASGAAADPKRVLGPPYTDAEIDACRTALSARADLTQYTTEATVRDLELVRQALGYERINLAAGSYGTKVAFVYLRRAPERLRAVVMEGVAPTNFRNPLPHSRGSQAALEALFRDCAADAACAARAPGLRAKFDSASARLAASPAMVQPPGAASPVPLDLDTFSWGVHLLQFSTQSAALLPGLIDRAARGDFTLLASILAGALGGVADQIDFGLQLSVTCTEDMPGLTAAEIARETEGTYLGSKVVEGMLAQCARWPRGAVPADFYGPVSSDVPVLLIAGALDPATPPGYAEEAARFLTAGKLVSIPHGAHITAHPCVDGLVAAFLARGTTAGLDAGCVTAIPRPPFQFP